jgi:RNA-directed DNA polymerase
MDGNKLFPTDEGTPQGGVISPLLANVALHGIEELIMGLAPKFEMRDCGGHTYGLREKIKSISLIRYAEDFVVLHEDVEVVKLCQVEIEKWLGGIGLELKPSKTRLANTLKKLDDEQPGFNFLGFNVRQFPVGKHNSGRVKGKLLGFKTIITPSKESQNRDYRKVVEVINKSRGLNQPTLIKNLNPIIRGWCNYFSTVVSHKIFTRLWHLVVGKFLKWGRHRHRNKGQKWIDMKYFQTVEGNNWMFATREGNNPLKLIQHSSTEIKRYVKVKGMASPYDGDWIYWSSRMGVHPEIPVRVAKLLKRQKGKCAHCDNYFKDGDSLLG